jgi:hypothetical protein
MLKCLWAPLFYRKCNDALTRAVPKTSNSRESRLYFTLLYSRIKEILARHAVKTGQASAADSLSERGYCQQLLYWQRTVAWSPAHDSSRVGGRRRNSVEMEAWFVPKTRSVGSLLQAGQCSSWRRVCIWASEHWPCPFSSRPCTPTPLWKGSVITFLVRVKLAPNSSPVMTHDNALSYFKCHSFGQCNAHGFPVKNVNLAFFFLAWTEDFVISTHLTREYT